MGRQRVAGKGRSVDDDDVVTGPVNSIAVAAPAQRAPTTTTSAVSVRTVCRALLVLVYRGEVILVAPGGSGSPVA
jgi:hypothetical protein